MRKERSEIIGRNALDTCFELLRETLEAEVPAPEPVPCEHDFQQSTKFLEAEECKLCGAMREGKEVQWYDDSRQ